MIQQRKLTFRKHLLIALQRMNDSRCRVPKTQPINAMREVLSVLVEHRTDMHMTPRKVQTLSADNVEIASHLVEREWSVNATCVVRLGGFVRAFGQIVCDTVFASIGQFFEDEILQVNFDQDMLIRINIRF